MPFFHNDARNGAGTAAGAYTPGTLALGSSGALSSGGAGRLVSRWNVGAVLHATLVCSCFLVFGGQLFATLLFALAHGLEVFLESLPGVNVRLLLENAPAFCSCLSSMLGVG